MEQEYMLYMYVYRMIRSDIYNGKYHYRDKLPTLLELCEIYNVGRNTVRSALLQLQQDGYVVMHKGVKATVSFQLNHFETQQQYKQDIKDSQQMIIDVFDTMAFLFPEISVMCLHHMTPAQFQELEKRVEHFSVEYIKNEYEMIQELYSIYSYAFSILNNDLLNDLFVTLMSSIYQPIMNDDEVYSELKRSIKMIQRALRFLVKSAKKHNDTIVKNIIVMMCKANSRLSKKYISELCEDLEPINEKEFIWVCRHNQDYLYLKVILKVLKSIQQGIYKKGATLPSIAKLAEEHEVSEKTIRKSLELLREYHIIETINGVGSKIIVDSQYDKSILSCSPMFQDNIKVFYDSLQLLSFLMPIIIPKVLKTASQEELISIKEKILQDNYPTLEPLYDYIVSQCHPCLQNILEELKHPMGWNIFLGKLIYSIPLDNQIYLNELLDAISIKDIHKVCQITDTIYQTSLEALQNHIKK